MDKAKAQTIVDNYNKREQQEVKRIIEAFALKQIGMPVSDWLGQATFDDVIELAKIIKVEELRLMTKAKVYHLAVWNEHGLTWAKTNLKDRMKADWFVVTKVDGGYKANTIGWITGNVLDPIPVEYLDIV